MATQTAISTVGRNRLEGKVGIITGDQGIGRAIALRSAAEGADIADLERRADFWDVTEQDYGLVLHVNLKGVFFTTQTVVRRWMAARRPGKIINISSVHEELPFSHFASYCASKGGLKMLTRDLAVELAPYGITINNISPGAIEAPINKGLPNDPTKLQPLLQNIPLKQLGTADDVAGVAAFLAPADAAYITGTTVFVDGGLLWS